MPQVFPRAKAWIALPLTIGWLGLASLSPALAQERIQLRTLTVTGEGVEKIPTTLTQVRLGVEVQGKEANAVQEEVARRSNAVVTLLKSRNVDKLETAGISLNPIYDYSNNSQRVTGYQGTNSVSFQVPTERVGTILDESVKAGASRIDSVSFTAEESAISAAQKRALQQATVDAQQQADAVLSALKLTRKEIVGIQINSASAPPPMPLYAEGLANVRAAKAPTPVIGGEQRVEGRVTLQISY